MKETIVAIYDDIVVARQVVEDLVKADFPRDSISLLTNDANNHYSQFLDKDYVPRDDAVTASEGASFGAVAGGFGGLLVGLAALPIPGLGLAIVAGPILAGLTGILFGAVTGGLVGALIKTGVPEDEAQYYAEGIRRGGTLISIDTDDTLRAKDILNHHGAVNIHERISAWRADGWEGFQSDVVEAKQTMTDEVIRDDAFKNDAFKNDAFKNDAFKNDVIKNDVIKNDVVRNEVVKDGVFNDDVFNDDVFKDDVFKDDAAENEVVVLEQTTQPYSTHSPEQTTDVTTNGLHGSVQSTDYSLNHDSEHSTKPMSPVVVSVPDDDTTHSEFEITEQLPEAMPFVPVVQDDERHLFDYTEDEASEIDPITDHSL